MTDPLDESDDTTVAMRRDFVLARLVPILLGILLGFLLVDQVVGLVDAVDEEGAMEPGHPVLGWNNKPGFVNERFETELDRFGFRNPEIPSDADPKEIRIAGFGASRLYGAGDEITQPGCWNYVLEQKLRDEGGLSVRVLNGAVMAYSMSQAALRAKLYLDAIQPDLVFVVASATMQFLLDDKEARRFVEIDGRPVPKHVADAWPRWTLPAVLGFNQFTGRNSAIFARHNNKQMMEGDLPPGVQSWLYFSEPTDPLMKRSIDTTWENLLALKEACDERGIELRIAVIPTSELLSPPRWQGWLRTYGATWGMPMDTPRRAPVDALIQRLRQLDLRVWDLSPETDRIGREFKRYMSADNGHWNAAGHELVAEGLARCLAQDQGLVARLVAARSADPRKRAFGPVPK